MTSNEQEESLSIAFQAKASFEIDSYHWPIKLDEKMLPNPHPEMGSRCTLCSDSSRPLCMQ